MEHKLAMTALIWSALGAAATVTMAAPVRGKVELPQNGIGPSPQRTKGFLDRVPNPYLPTRVSDPMPRLVVVLEGDTTAVPPPAVDVFWDFLGQSFSRTVFATRIGTTVVIRNRGRTAPILKALEDPTLVPPGPVNPGAQKELRIKTAGVYAIVDQDLPFLGGRILALQTPYFAMVGADGRFEIPDVPPGRWRVRVWYDTNWVDRTDENITVGSSPAELNLRLPAGLGTVGAAPTTPLAAAPTPPASPAK